MSENRSQNPIEKRIYRLKECLEHLKNVEKPVEKLKILDETIEIKNFISSHPFLSNFFEKLKMKDHISLKFLVLIGQENILLAMIHHGQRIEDSLLQILSEINHFYETSNGLITYQLNILKLILENECPKNECSKNEFKPESKTLKACDHNYLKPMGIDLRDDPKVTAKLVRIGLENLDKMAEIYPVGGAGERLKLTSKTNEPLPVAMLPFLGKSLLEGLIRDLQGREFLYFKLKGKQLLTPIAMMTSDENNNEEYIRQLCKSKLWFHRGIHNFLLFRQPMVPVVTETGDWVLSSHNTLLCKPSGHGVIWKLGVENGVLDRLKQLGRTKMVSRQINNPIAGIDNGLLGFAGAGFKDDKAFGFYSCDRVVGSSEGMDVLLEKETPAGFEYKITNVEYTEFEKKGIKDQPNGENGFSKFPANTNILFVDILKVEQAVQKNPIPGILVNMKTSLPVIDDRGHLKCIKVGRLESTMQNIADEIIDVFPKKLDAHQNQKLSSYITFNDRKKTISVTKKALVSIDAFSETPQAAFCDMLENFHHLFSVFCQMKLPAQRSPEAHMKIGPSFMVQYHPSLGPLFSIIAQKIRKGIILENSELQLEIAELDMENLHLDGSLLIDAKHALGMVDEHGILEYGKNLGKCKLKNVTVKNSGVDRTVKNFFWKNEIKRLESLSITLHGDSEFIAEDVVFEGNFELEVMDRHRMVASMQDGKVHFTTEKMQENELNQPYWSYSFDSDDNIILNHL